MFSFFRRRRGRVGESGGDTATPREAPSAASHRTTHARPRRQILEALPCTDYYEHFPEDIGPLGNVEISNGRELQSWLLVARPVSRAEAEAKGGCIKFTPLHVDPLHGAGVEPQYFSITDPDDVVYGRAQYISPSTPVEKEGMPICGRAVNTESCEEDSDEVSANRASASVVTHISSHDQG